MKQPLVSIIIRTCQRPDVLRGALESIRNQTYSNLEIIVVEDGENKSEHLLQNDFSDLNYMFRATEKKVGRSQAGNLALKLAKGVYFNFLDDDDKLFPNHIELLVNYLVNDTRKAAYSIAEEHQIIIKSKKPYKYKIKKVKVRFKQTFNKLLLYTFNYIPIQSIMFERSLYDELGGFDEQLETLEDWDLWVRYSTKTDYIFVDKITSCYHTPYGRKIKQKRAGELKDYLEPLNKKFYDYKIEVSVQDINQEMAYVLREYKNKGLIRYLRIFFRMVFLGER